VFAISKKSDCLKISRCNVKSRTASEFLIFKTQILIHTEIVGIIMTYFHTNFHICRSNTSLLTHCNQTES